MSVHNFVTGGKVSIADLTEAEARAIFGDPVYEAWLATKDDIPGADMVVSDVCHRTKTITLKAAK